MNTDEPEARLTAERWRQVEALFLATRDRGPSERATFLEQACGTDVALRLQVESLLAADQGATGFLEPPGVPAPPMPDLETALRVELAGRYAIERELGRGGMATVYLADDVRHHRQVAIKVLHPDLGAVLGAERFLREIGIAARLSHPHILPLHDSGTLDLGLGRPVLFYVMPYVAGRSLRERLREELQLPIDEALGIARQVADALEHAHRQGVIHRDIKPENILLADGQAVLADFGIARALDVAGGDRLTETGLAIGTPAYMSPEQSAGSTRLDARSDIYALGCVLYEMLGGQPPFLGPTPQAILARHAMDPVPSLRTLRPTVPRALGQVVTQALAKVPADRFPTARAFGEALATASLARARSGDDAPTAVVGATRSRLVDTAYSFAISTLRAIRRHRVLAATVVGLTVLAAWLAVKAHSRRIPAPNLDPASLAVAPFSVSAADPSLGYLREGIVDLLTARLGGTAALSPVESRELLRVWHTMSGGSGDLTEHQALTLAGQMGAGRLIEGEIVGRGSHLTISSRLLDVSSRRVLVQETVEGSSDSLPPLLDRLAARLLPISAGLDQRRLPSLTGTPLAALRPYLSGEALDRRGFTDSAAKSFGEALRADSTFALAALRLAQTSDWPDVSEPAERAAWTYRNRLSAVDQADLMVTLGPAYPEDSYLDEHIAAAEHYVQVAPQSSRAWFVLGAELFDIGPLVGLPEAQARAAAAFQRAVAVDSTDPHALEGLTVAAGALGDTVTARKALALLQRQRGDSSSDADFGPRWFLAAITGDTAALHRALRSDSITPKYRTRQPVGRGLEMIRLGLHQGLDLREVEGVLDRALAAAATQSQRAEIRWNQDQLLAIRGVSDKGPPAGSSREPVTYIPLPPTSTGPIFDFLFADLDSTGWDSVGVALTRQIGSNRVDECCIPRFGAGEYALETGRLALAERAAKDLLTYHGPSLDADSAFSTRVAHQYGMILQAQIAARRRDPSAADRLRELDSVLANPLDAWMPSMGNLVAARLHEARGELGAALAAVRRRSWGLVCPSYVAYHREEGRLAALTGDTTSAIRAYRRYLALRGGADPKLQDRVQQVRSALATLEQAAARH